MQHKINTTFWSIDMKTVWLLLILANSPALSYRNPTWCHYQKAYPINATIGIQFVCLFYKETNRVQLIMNQRRANACTNERVFNYKKRSDENLITTS